MPKNRTQKQPSRGTQARLASRSGPALASAYDEIYHRPDAIRKLTPGMNLLSDHYLLPRSRVLDLGSGVADPIFLARAGHNVVAIDISPVAVKRLNEVSHAERLILSGRLQDITRGLPQGPFDIIMMMAVSHHLTPEQFAALLVQVKASIIPSGYIYVRLMDANSYLATLRDWRGNYFCTGETEIERLFPGWQIVLLLTNEVPAFDSKKHINTYTVALLRCPHTPILKPSRGSGPTAF